LLERTSVKFYPSIDLAKLLPAGVVLVVVVGAAVLVVVVAVNMR
jgi:hypothetical protein